ncbi:MAG: hypothetical protein AB7E13_11275 [Arcobacteraceae bacterium]|jgi:hypothetical protein
MKNYLFLTNDGFTYDKGKKETNNFQLLGTGAGDNIFEAFNNFKHNQSYLLAYDFKNIMAVEYRGDFITNLKL